MKAKLLAINPPMISTNINNPIIKKEIKVLSYYLYGHDHVHDCDYDVDDCDLSY